MKSIPVDVSQFRFLVVNEPEAVVDFTTKAPKANRDGEPLFSVEILASREGHKGEVLVVKVAGKPAVSEGQKVKLSLLEALPWENNGRSGLSFSVDKIEVVASSAKAAA